MQVVETLLRLVKTIKEPNSHERHVMTLVDDILQVYLRDKPHSSVGSGYTPREICCSSFCDIFTAMPVRYILISLTSILHTVGKRLESFKNYFKDDYVQ